MRIGNISFLFVDSILNVLEVLETLDMENPGRVLGSKAVYYKIIDRNGHTLRVYKETYDPDGNLVHTKEK